jgi:hypothetical protein
MIIDTSVFSDFLSQNRDVLTYPVKSYPINEQNFARWIENHSEPYRPLAAEFRRSTRHVSFNEFKETIGNVFADILQYIYTAKPDTIFLFVYPQVKKSNFLVALYLYSLLEAYKFKNIKIITDTDDFTIVKSNDLVILPDDASYSGQQLVEFFGYIPPRVEGTYFMAIPYISHKARSRIENLFRKKSLPIIFSDKTQVFEPFLGDENNLYTIYFDHKLADFISIYNSTYAMGEDAKALKDPNFIYEPMSLITGCENVKDECPPPFYKKYNYKYNARRVENISEIDSSQPDSSHKSSVSLASFLSPMPQSYASSVSLPPPSYDSYYSAPPSYHMPSLDSLPPPPSFYTGKRRSKNRSKRRSKNRSRYLL